MFRHVPIAAVILLGGCLPIIVGRPPIAGPVPVAVAQAPPVPVPLRVETAGGNLCNGVRIDADTVATAAHCVSDGTTVTVVERGVARVVATVTPHPGHSVLPAAQAGGVDLARLTLASPDGRMGAVAVRPIQPRAVEIRVLTRAGELRDIPCGFLGQSGRLVELSCAVGLGWSSAPVVQDGALVGILSARGRVRSVDIVQMADAMGLLSF